MKRYCKIVALFLSLCLLLTIVVGCQANKPEPAKVEEKVEKFPLKLMDDLGRLVEIKEKPEKIISLAPSNTEILFALGLGDKVVGVTEFCDYPEEAKSKEKAGGFKEPNLEKLVELRPDVIFATGMHQKSLPDIEKLNLAVFVIDSKSINDVILDIETVGKITDSEKAAEKVVAEMQEKIDMVKEKLAILADVEKPLVYYEIWNDPIQTVGPGTFIYGIIELAGGKNIVEGAAEEYPLLSLETLIKRDPAVIIAGVGSMGDPGKVKERKGWENISAVKNEKVYVIDENLVVRPGPRIADGLVEIARILHPEKF